MIFKTRTFYLVNTNPNFYKYMYNKLVNKKINKVLSNKYLYMDEIYQMNLKRLLQN